MVNNESESASDLEGDKPVEGQDDKRILEEAFARFKLAEEAEQSIRSEALTDKKFRAGRQWPDEIVAQRKRDGRPCLTVNRLPQFIQQVTNDQRQNRPSIKVHPVDDKADPETAKVLQGLVRHIENNSNADVAYDTAFDGAATGGFGWIRVIKKYLSPFSFDQEIFIKRVRNEFSVFFDPNSQEPDGSDANWAFVIEDLSKTDFRAQYPKAKLNATGADWDSLGTQRPGWVNGDILRVAEYFYREYKPETICLLEDGSVVKESELTEGAVVVETRRTQIPYIRWCKINGDEVLEKTDWDGKWIPVIPVYGNELYLDGEKILEGVVRHARDPQQMLNIWKSAETETIGLAPKAPFIAAEGQIEKYAADWATANTRAHSVLKYTPKSLDGTPVPPPQRQAFEPAVQAITQAAALASEDLKATTGIYDAAMGARSNETSGIAINSRRQQAQTSNFHFIDNLTRSIKHVGRIVLDLIPHTYDTARTARIIGEEGEQEVIKINQLFQHKGKQITYNLGVGTYDVTVDVGPSYASKRQEAVAAMLELSKAVPQLMGIAGDLMVRSMDWPQAKEIAERLRKTLPPGLAEDPENKGQQIPPEVQQQMQAAQQMVEQLTAQVNELKTEKDQKLIEIESKERIEMAKLENQATIELAKLESNESLKLLAHQISELDARTKQLGIEQPFETEEPQEFEQGEAGGIPADGMAMNEDPTGGESPGTSMEGLTP